MLWNFCQRPNLTSAMSHGGKSGGGGGGQYSFQADDQKGVQALWGQLYPNYSEEDTPDFFTGFTLFTSLSDYRIVVRSVSLSNGQVSTSVIVRLVLLMFTGIVIK